MESSATGRANPGKMTIQDQKESTVSGVSDILTLRYLLPLNKFWETSVKMVIAVKQLANLIVFSGMGTSTRGLSRALESLLA
jgi:hypothetical protein